MQVALVLKPYDQNTNDQLYSKCLWHVRLETLASTSRKFPADTFRVWKQFIIISFLNNINLKLNNLSKDRQLGGGRANMYPCHLN